MREDDDMKRLGFAAFFALLVIAIALIYIFGARQSRGDAPPVLPGDCVLAHEAHIEGHPFTARALGRLVAQQIADDGFASDDIPPKEELVHAATVVGDSCL
jgi:hypothetical protein